MPRIVDHDVRRAEILDGCFGLFARKGYAAVTMREIAREVGASTGSVYHYFATKEALFRQMFERLSEQDALRAGDAVDAADPQERLQQLVAFVEQHRETFEHALLMALEYHRQHADAESRAFVAHVAGRYRAALRAVTRLPAGLEGPLLSALMGYVLHRLLDPDGVDLAGHLALLGLSPASAAP